MRPVRLGPALRAAWVGYRRRLEAELAAAGFADHALLDGRVLRICSRSEDVTVAEIGRELGMTRQGAGKLVAGLSARGYVDLTPSLADRREKLVTLTPRALAYLEAHRSAARRIERDLRDEIGDEAFQALGQLMAALAGAEQPRLADYLSERAQRTIDIRDFELE